MCATKLEDLEKRFSIPCNATIEEAESGFKQMMEACAENGSKLVPVMDAECELVCLAPLAIAQEIARLLNEYADIP